MNTTITTPIVIHRKHRLISPRSPRGRALHTLDWFLNGRPVLHNHDNPWFDLRDGFPG